MHLAQLNLGRLAMDLDDPRAGDFLRGRDVLDRLLQRQPGFVWRHSSAFGQSGTVVDNDPRILVSLSVWESLATLEAFVWKTVHKHFWERRGEWFAKPDKVHHVLWWVAIGHQPPVAEALGRLDDRRENGDSDRAFGWTYARANFGEAA